MQRICRYASVSVRALLALGGWIQVGIEAAQAGPGYALSFDGVDDYVDTQAAVIPASGDFTVECWAYSVAGSSAYRHRLYNRPRWVPSPAGTATALRLFGAGVVTNECHTAYVDSGALQFVSPVAIAAGYEHSLAIGFDEERGLPRLLTSAGGGAAEERSAGWRKCI